LRFLRVFGVGGSGTAKGEKYGDSSFTTSVLSIRVETPSISLKMGEGTVVIYLEQGRNPCVSILDGIRAPVNISLLRSTSY